MTRMGASHGGGVVKGAGSGNWDDPVLCPTGLAEGGLRLPPNTHGHPSHVLVVFIGVMLGVRINMDRGATRGVARGYRQPHSVATMLGTWCALMRSSDRVMSSLPA